MKSSEPAPETPGVSAAYRLLGLDPPTLTRADLESTTGVPHERSVQWWRAMGFPEVAEGERVFRAEDEAMVRQLDALLHEDVIDNDEVLRLARLMGASFSRLAEAQLEVIDELFTSPTPEGHARRVDLAALATAADTDIVEILEGALLYVWRRHLLAAIGHRLAIDDEHTDQAVGFADLSGFSRLSKEASSIEIGEIIDEFEKIAYDVVTQHGGRVVKLIGDEVMFVSSSVDSAVSIGVELIARLDPVPNMPDIHCGVAWGPTVVVGGDVFGPTANRASRLTDVARQGSIALSRKDADRLSPRDDVTLNRVRRSYDLKGVGRTAVVAIRPQTGP